MQFDQDDAAFAVGNFRVMRDAREDPEFAAKSSISDKLLNFVSSVMVALLTRYVSDGTQTRAYKNSLEPSQA